MKRFRHACSFALSASLTLFGASRHAHAQSIVDTPASAESSSPIESAEAPPVQPAPHPAPKVSPPIGLRLDGGYAPRKLVSLPVVGADMGLALGAQPSRHAAFWGASRLFLGSTENGLSVFSFRFGGELEAVIDRFRIGGGLHVFTVGLSRATRDATIMSWGPAVAAALRVDLIQSEGFALFARAAIDAGFEIYNSTLFWGPTLGVGVDFDIGGKRASLK